MGTAEELVNLKGESPTLKPDVVAAPAVEINKQRIFENKPPSVWKNIKLQTLSSTVISFSMMHMGMAISFPNLLRGHMNETMISNFACLGAISTPVGSCITSLLTDRFGRKKTLIVFELLSVLTWFLVALADKDAPILFYASGVFTGITRGALTSHSPAFISEITHNDHRQMFLSFTTFFFTIAYCLTSLLNLWLTWKNAAWCFGAIFVLLTISTFFFVPESPHWLAVIRKDTRRARNTLKKYNPNEKMFEKEWSVIQKKAQSIQTTNSKTRLISLIRQPTVYKPSIILLLLLFFQQACCIYPLSAYVVLTLPVISEPMEKYKAAVFIVVSGVRLFISIVTTIFLSRFNQKQLLSISFVGMVMSSIPLAGIKMLTASTTNVDQTSWSDWLLVSCFVLYTAFGSVAALGVPWTIIFELLPTEARGLLGPYFVAFGYVTMSAFLKYFLPALMTIGVVSMFLIIALLSLAGSVFIHVCVPETRGQSLSDIENKFSIKK